MLHVTNAVSSGTTPWRSATKCDLHSSRNQEAEMLGGETDMWQVSEREDPMRVLAPESHGSAQKEKERR